MRRNDLIQKKTVTKRAIVVGLLIFLSVAILYGFKALLLVNKTPKTTNVAILENYGPLQDCRLSAEEITNIIQQRQLENANCSYKVVEDLTGPSNISTYLLVIQRRHDSSWEYEGVIAIDQSSGSRLVDFNFVWGYYDHKDKFYLNTKYEELKDVVRLNQSLGAELEIHKNTFVNHGMAEYSTFYRLTPTGFQLMGN